MRITVNNDMTAAIIVVMLIVLLIALAPVRPQMWLYPVVRRAAQSKIVYETRHMASFETEHFIVRYTPGDASTVQMVADAAELAYGPVTELIGHQPGKKQLILIYPDKNELRKLFGWTGDESAMGAYWGGVIQILSPSVWMKEGQSAAEFVKTGPVVHEFTHLVFDYRTSGNYPRWFTEGLAQYVEYKVNHYEWLTPRNKMTGRLYSMTELDRDFDSLDDQSMAYRQALAAVRYIAEVHGEDKLRAVIGGLQSGKNIQKVIFQTLGMDYAAYEKAWHEWAPANMQNYSGRNN